MVSGEDAPGDVASCHTGGVVEMLAAKVLVPMLSPVTGSSRQTVTLVGASIFAGTAAHFTHTRTRTRRGLGQSIPKKRMIAPARPLPLTPLASATDASALDLLPPGKMAGRVRPPQEAKTELRGEPVMALDVCQGTLAVAGRVGLLGMALHVCRGTLAVAGRVGLLGAGKLRRVQAAGMATLRQSLK